MTNTSAPKKPGGYQNLIVYQQAVIIYDLNIKFCQRYLADYGKGTPTRRTVDQMIQAARSGKQNIVEASLEKSLKLNIKLTGVARASFGELKEDYMDFLRIRTLPIWDKNDPRVLEIRLNKTNLANWANLTNVPERFANLMITLISRESYLLDQLLRSLEQKFINEGGYSENLFRKRLQQREKTG
ncbi:MAG: four helix bundle protein [Candidatus Levybacteria bacterium]|nr:four helix bundle protein [Candidatus Levybacteria bacterium]MBI2622621.1 four helix bundle protein [Candidatus Levybacteria bacterium]MBI3093081.1 four helix bundle protein [Candidatus Levybacteria bacterium]